MITFILILILLNIVLSKSKYKTGGWNPPPHKNHKRPLPTPTNNKSSTVPTKDEVLDIILRTLD